MATVQNLVDDTLIEMGVLDPGETPSSADRDYAFTQLNRLLSSWSAAGVPVFKVTKSTVSMTGATNYNLGTRPLKVRSASVISGNESRALRIVTPEEYSAVSWDRSRTGKFAEVLLYDGAYSTGVVHLWPTPANGGSLELWTVNPLAAFSALSDTIDMPPGYERAMRSSLALELASSYRLPVTPELTAAAQEAKESIARLNAEVLGPAPAAKQ
jgi:hypothetical protein